MSSRSSAPSTTSSAHRRSRGGDNVDQSTTARLSRRRFRRRPRPYGAEPRAASMTDTLSPISMSGDPECRAASMIDTPSPIPMSEDPEGRVTSMTDTHEDPEGRVTSMTDTHVHMTFNCSSMSGYPRRAASMTDMPSLISMSERRFASMTDTVSPISKSGDPHSLLLQPLNAIDVGVQSQYQELQESEPELDSPPRITILPVPEEEPDSPIYAPASPMGPIYAPTSPIGPIYAPTSPIGPTSPTGSPRATSVRVNASGSPKDSPNDTEDEHFNYLVGEFVSVAANVCSSTLSDDELKEVIQKKYVLCAKRALEHYNNDDKNKVKYELISTTMCNDMLIREGCFSHVNFTAKGNELNENELFFAELRWDNGTPVPTCVICFKGIKKIGGLRDSKYDNFYLKGLPIDTQHCYACDWRLKHPKNGDLYSIGHVAMSEHY